MVIMGTKVSSRTIWHLVAITMAWRFKTSQVVQNVQKILDREHEFNFRCNLASHVIVRKHLQCSAADTITISQLTPIHYSYEYLLDIRFEVRMIRRAIHNYRRGRSTWRAQLIFRDR